MTSDTHVPAVSLATVTTIIPVADAYVDASHPNTNYGTSNQLRVDGSPIVRSYLRFDVQGISGTITQVTLRVYANGSLNTGVTADGVTDNTWGETTINYSNAPLVGSAIGTSGAVTAGTWISIDVTSYVTGNGTHSFALTSANSKFLAMGSRESTNKPQLVVTTASASTPTPTSLPTAKSTSTATATKPPTSTSTPASTPTASSTPTNTSTPSSTATGTNTNTPVPATATNTPTATSTPTVTLAATATSSPTPTSTSTPTTAPSLTATPTSTYTPAASNTPTNTPASTATSTPTDTATPTTASAATNTATPSATSASGTITVNPDADAYVNSAYPSTNYGTSTQLRVDGSPIVNSYLRFTVSGLSGAVTQASLEIYANSNLSTGVTANQVADNTWGETTITYGNAPTIGAAVGTSSAITAGTWITLDVTPYITGNGTYSIAITSANATALSMASRESTTPPQLVLSTGGSATSTPAATSTSAATPTATSTPVTNSAPPNFSHVYTILMENKEYGDIVGNTSAPYINSLIAQYGLATNYDAVAHPSEPNYIALFSGSTQGVTTDGNYDLAAQNVADQIEATGRSWMMFAQNVPLGCFTGSMASGGEDGTGNYARKHEPAISFTDISGSAARCANITDLTHFDPTAANYEFITPNLCNDMHDCSIASGDAFLQGFVPNILNSPAWQQGGVLFITWDEGTTSIGGGGQVATLVIASNVTAGYRSATPFTHYSLLRTIEDAWVMGCLANTCPSNNMAEFFR